MKKHLSIALCFIFFISHSKAQTSSTPTVNVITADSLASGNYKDVFTSFFKLAADDIMGPQKSVSFTSNPYAIMAKGNPALTVDTNYKKYHILRNINFNLGLTLDSNYKPAGFNLGLKYTILNKRDVTVSNGFIRRATKTSQLSVLRSAFDSLLSADTTITDAMNLEFENWMNKQAVSFASLSADLQHMILGLDSVYRLDTVAASLKAHPERSFRDQVLAEYNSLKDEWQRKPLWTISGNSLFLPLPGSTTPSVNSLFFATEFLWMFKSPNSLINMEMDILAVDSFTRDNSQTTQSISHNVYAIEPGVNFVVKSKNDGKSFFEFKLSGTYSHILSHAIAGQSVDSSTLNATLRLRLINDIWAPLTLKMDNRGHVYGALGLKLNFNAIAGMLKQRN